MITKAIQISLLVKDQQEAKEFYVERLGFVVCSEMELAPGWSYLTVAPKKENKTQIELVKAESPEQLAMVGNQDAIRGMLMFESDDIEKDYQELKSRGVNFHGRPKVVPGGRGVGFEDLYGNELDLFQPDR